jgi:hypothetical protein
MLNVGVLSRRIVVCSVLVGLALPSIALAEPELGQADKAIGSKWRTYYVQGIEKSVSRKWRLNKVLVNVPDSLKVSEKNRYAPKGDIVWRGEPLGDRRKQVAAIMTTAIKGGARGLRGGKRVNFNVEMIEFHALSEKLRKSNINAGIHNISFTIEVVDSRNGRVIVAKQPIQADLIGYTGKQARELVAAGQTQKVRITNHVAAVIQGWLGQGPDMRKNIKRRGR